MRREQTTRAKHDDGNGMFSSVLGMLLTKEMHVSCTSAVGVMVIISRLGSLDSRSFTDSDDLLRHLLLIYKFTFCLRRFTIGSLKKVNYCNGKRKGFGVRLVLMAN